MAKHRSDMRRGKNCTSSLIVRWQNSNIELIELFPCNSREELNAREGHWIRESDCVNKNIAGNFIEKGRVQYNQEYRHNNPDRYNKKVVCECGRTVVVQHKAKHLTSQIHQRLMDLTI